MRDGTKIGSHPQVHLVGGSVTKVAVSVVAGIRKMQSARVSSNTSNFLELPV